MISTMTVIKQAKEECGEGGGSETAKVVRGERESKGL